MGHRLDGHIPDPIDPKAFLNLVEMAIDFMYKLKTNGEFLEQRMEMTKDEIIASAKDLKRKNPSTESRKATRITITPKLRFTDTNNTAIRRDHGRDPSTWSLGRPNYGAPSTDYSIVGMGQAGGAGDASGESLAPPTLSKSFITGSAAVPLLANWLQPSLRKGGIPA